MITGVYFDGHSSKQTSATMVCDVNGVVRLDVIDPLDTTFAELTISPRLGNTVRYIRFANGGQFETSDNDAVDQWQRQFSGKITTGLAYRLESTKSVVLLSMVVVIGFCWAFVQWGIPYFSQQIADIVPQDVSVVLGEGVLKTLDAQLFSPSQLSSPRQQVLTEWFTTLATASSLTANMTLEFRRGGLLQANALALPHNVVVITDELVQLADDDLELVAILLHEIGHLHHKHSLRTAVQRFSLAMLAMLVTGDVSTSSSVIIALPIILIEAGFSQSMEWEADGYALAYMERNNIDPNHFVTIMGKLEASHRQTDPDPSNCDEKELTHCPEGPPLTQVPESVPQPPEHQKQQQQKNSLRDYFSTHPATTDRIARFRQAATQSDNR